MEVRKPELSLWSSVCSAHMFCCSVRAKKLYLIAFSPFCLLTSPCLADEPTNNLDIETIDALVDAINEFNGGIVVVTHDQRLIESCQCTLWVVEKRGVTKWEAGFDDYKATLLKEMEEQVEREAKERQAKIDAAAAARAEKMARLAKKVKK